MPKYDLWLTLYLTNVGQSDVTDIAADLSLLPRIHGIYPYSAPPWKVPTVIAGGHDQTWVTVAFRDLAAGEAHTVFIAVRPATMVGPPYEEQTQRQWVDQYGSYWKQLSITLQGRPTHIQYGLASTWFPITQYADTH